MEGAAGMNTSVEISGSLMRNAEPMSAKDYGDVIASIRPIQQITHEAEDGFLVSVSVLDDVPAKSGVALSLNIATGSVRFWKWADQETAHG
jgi:hypothetical protein